MRSDIQLDVQEVRESRGFLDTARAKDGQAEEWAHEP
jgi:hypothetical protein